MAAHVRKRNSYHSHLLLQMIWCLQLSSRYLHLILGACVCMWWTHQGLFKLEYDIAHPMPSTRPHFGQLSLLVTSQLELRIWVVYSWKRFERVIVLFKCCKKNRGKWFCRISFWLQCLICSQLLILLALLLQWDNTIYKQKLYPQPFIVTCTLVAKYIQVNSACMTTFL